MLGLKYPNPPDGLYLVNILIDLGWSENNSFGVGPLQWSEIKAYADAVGVPTEPWEFRCIRDMSNAYAIEKNNNEIMRIAPNERKIEND